MAYLLSDWQSGVPIPKGWDVADAVADGWGRAEIEAFMRATVRPWSPPEAQERPAAEPSSAAASRTRPEAARPAAGPSGGVADEMHPFHPDAPNDDPGSAPAPAPAPEASGDKLVKRGKWDVHKMPCIDPMLFPDLSHRGKPLGTIPNLQHLLAHYGFTVQYDVIRKDMMVRHPGQEGTADNQRAVSVNTILSLCARNELPKMETVQFLLNIADANPSNPVMSWITSKPWDGRSRLADLAATLHTRPDYDRALLRLVLRRWVVSAVAAAAMPSGFRGRGVLVLQGPQNIGKTAWFMRLVPDDLRDLIKVDALIDPANKDTIISALSHWLVELGELDATFRKADVARLKGFLTADFDMFRRPYARGEERYPRRTVFFASVNDAAFLIDDTGNTRWWTVPVIDVNHGHTIDMQQLWAEALEVFRTGERWWLDRAEDVLLETANDRHRRIDPIEDLILSRLDLSARADRTLTATEVLIEIGFDRPTNGQAQKAGQVLTRLFGEPKRLKGRTVYAVPPLISDRGSGWQSADFF